MSNKVLKFCVAAALVLAGYIYINPDFKGEPKIPENPPIDASTETNRIDYFSSHGWEVEEISSKDITIPLTFAGEYEKYASLQDKQGMPLREYAGKSGKIYTYEVQNYSPDESRMLAELLVCNEVIVASMIYSEEAGKPYIAVS